ncbi:hypothetical protein OIU84_020908 [Salix udensis]|uniref:Uncharacterized protein n=1 Tax=Salix udensis TaxID=889485 RepID=A0AAD6KTD5_9ROSI|nr:hypothetical protein OIU84_020908 [Salix udensis]
MHRRDDEQAARKIALSNQACKIQSSRLRMKGEERAGTLFEYIKPTCSCTNHFHSREGENSKMNTQWEKWMDLSGAAQKDSAKKENENLEEGRGAREREEMKRDCRGSDGGDSS